MERKLFCEIHPAFYRVSVAKGRALRHLQNLRDHACLATVRRDEELTKLVEATNGHSLVEAENAICYDIVRGYGLRRSLFWRRRVFFHGTKKQKTSVYRNV